MGGAEGELGRACCGVSGEAVYIGESVVGGAVYKHTYLIQWLAGGGMVLVA